jgi:TPR repeat protein
MSRQFTETRDAFRNAMSEFAERDPLRGVRLMEDLAASGDGHAHAALGAFYEFGRQELTADHARAARHYELAIDLVGALEAWIGLGRILAFGDPGLRDYARARHCFFVAAEDADSPTAWLGLGIIHLEGLGTERDLDAAEACFKRVVSLGDKRGEARLAEVEQRRNESPRDS